MKVNIHEIIDGLLALQQHTKVLGRELSTIDLIGLSLVRRNPGLILSKIAGTRSVSAAGITGMVDKLEKQGLVERRGHEDDRRKKCVFLTPQGEALAGHLESLALQQDKTIQG
jgi:DNA-binding MarR family transcriptional regulator